MDNPRCLIFLLTLSLSACSWLPGAQPDEEPAETAVSKHESELSDTDTSAGADTFGKTDAEAVSKALQVTVDGVDGELRANILATLRINQITKTDRPLPNPARLRWLHDQAEQDINNALAPFGYYRPQVSGSLRETAPGAWQAEYSVTPGPVMPLSKVDIQLFGAGRDDPAFQQRLADQPLAVGQDLNHPKYEQTKQSLIGLATERGYFDARFRQSQIRVDLDAYQAAIVLHYETGERYRFGEVRFEQTDKGEEPTDQPLSDELLQRYVDFQPGDPYLASTLLQLQSDLINSQYFASVAVSAPLAQAQNQTIPVRVETQSRKTRTYSVGLGYGTDTGIRGRGGLNERQVNRWGHRYEVQLLASQVTYALGGQYIIPGNDPRTDSYNLRSNISVEDTDIKEATTASLGVSKQRQDGPWLKIASLDYQWEEFTIGDQPTETTGLLIAGLNWSRVDAAPDRINVSDGTRFSFEVRGGAEFALSDISFLQGALGGKWIKSFTEDDRIIMRGEAGSTYIDSADFDQLPATLRFFTGGDNSVRGYSLDSIGPTNDDDDVIGGRHLLVGSLEYERRLFGAWSVAAFVDTGDAFDDTPALKTGVGVGMRWQSPVGPVRVDLASGLDDPGDVVRLHIGIGPDL